MKQRAAKKRESGFVALPPEHAAASRLGWRAIRAIMARAQGWTLDSLCASRTWRFHVGRSRWTAMAFISSHFFHQRPGTVVRAIYFTGNGSLDALHNSALVEELHSRLGVYWWGRDRKSLLATSSDDSRPRILLGELDRIAAAFGSTDRHRVPSSRTRSVGKRLAESGDAVLANGTWDLQAASLWIWRDSGTSVNISAIPKLSTMVFTPEGSSVGRAARCKARGYRESSSKQVPHVALMKLQPLSLRAALAEAKLLEDELER